MSVIHIGSMFTVEELVQLINQRLCDWESRYTGTTIMDRKFYNSVSRFNFQANSGEELNISIQAGANNYSFPRENEVTEFTSVEIGFPSWEFLDEELLLKADDRYNPTDTIYSYIPIKQIAKEIINKVREVKIEVIPDILNLAVIHTVNNSALWS